MRTVNRYRIAHVLLLGALAVTPARSQSAPGSEGVHDHFLAYTQAAIAGDLPAALACWHPDDVGAAARLGVTPAGTAPRVDADSPLWRFIDEIRDETIALRFGPPTLLQTGPFAGHASLVLVTDPRGPRRATKQYLLEPDGRGGWLLTSHERILADRGPAVAGRFVTVFERRPGEPWAPPPRLLADLDDAVAGMVARLDLSPRRLADLEAGRLHYVLASAETVAYVSSSRPAGAALPPSDLVLTSDPYDLRGLARLVVGVWLETPPPVTLPLLREGLVWHLAGRQDRDPRRVESSGRAILGAGELTLGDLFASDRWHALPAEAAAPPAAVFAGFLLAAFGPEGLRAAYHAVSGSAAEVATWSAEAVEQRLAAALQTTWGDVATRFAAWLAVDEELDGSARGR